jgi:hypothetical protein
MNQTLKQALKQLISAACGVILANVVDPSSQIFSLAWLKHLGVVIFFVTLVNEARYWKSWADGPNGD